MKEIYGEFYEGDLWRRIQLRRSMEENSMKKIYGGEFNDGDLWRRI